MTNVVEEILADTNRTVLEDVLAELHAATGGGSALLDVPRNVDPDRVREALTNHDGWEVALQASQWSTDLFIGYWGDGPPEWERHVPNRAAGMDVAESREYHRLRKAGISVLTAHRALKHGRWIPEPRRSTYLTLLTDGTPIERAVELSRGVHPEG